jgi:FixJ family two-component response regulator
MPRLSGRDVILRLREIDPTVPIVASSGFSSEDETRALKAGGAVAFVEKPYHAFDLLRVVRSALDGA